MWIGRYCFSCRCLTFIIFAQQHTKAIISLNSHWCWNPSLWLNKLELHCRRTVFTPCHIIRVQIGHAIAQPVSRRLPTAVARVSSYGICGGQTGVGAGFLRVLWFPLPIFITPIAPQSPSSIICGWYNRPVVAAVPSRLSFTPLRRITRVQIPLRGK
jgi:hypothetical protein